MRKELLTLAADLAQRGEPYVFAVVVGREPASSAQPGDMALITEDGTMHGWLGGSCVKPTILREAKAALRERRPRVVALSPEPARDRRAGVVVHRMTCHSGGTVDIYVEPVLPAARLVVFGSAPTARALCRLGKAMGWVVEAVDPEADRGVFPDVDAVLAHAQPRGASRRELYAVVATMGQRDEEALREALALEPTWAGVVASRKRYAELRETLVMGGAPAASFDRVKNPAGLDLGGHTPEEIALSIVAEVVRDRRAAEVKALEPAVRTAPAANDETAIDPICGMTVDDSGNYGAALELAMKKIGYADLRREQADKRARGELMGIGVSSFTEIVGAGPSKHFDILGLKMFDSCELRVHPTGKAIARFGTKSQGQGHETTYAQIIAEELGIPASAVQVEEGDTDTAPYGLGTYASRSTPTAGAAGAMAARKVRDKARKIAAHLLEASEEDLVWEPGKFSVKGAPQRAKTIQEIAFAAYTNHPQGMEAGLEAVSYYDPPNMTYPFGTYICVVDIDRGTGMVSVRRFVAVDDCGNIINPMIVDGQIHGGLTMGLAPALYEEISYDEDGNIHGGSFMDYLLPTAMETPAWELDKTVTPSPHHPFGAKGVGESATVGAPPAIVNAVVDALWHLGVRHVDIPITPEKVWKLLREKGVAA